MWCPLYSLFLRFAGVGSLGSDVDVAQFCFVSGVCMVVTAKIEWVPESPWAVVFVLGVG